MMNKEDERITYEEFMTMFKFAPRMCYTLYDRAENEIENLQKKTEQGEHYKHLYSEVKKQYEEADYDRHKLFEENQQLKKQKDDVIEYLGDMPACLWNEAHEYNYDFDELLRMLGEIDE